MKQNRIAHVATWIAACSTMVLVCGCGEEPVREDRSFHWAPDGALLSFQHGQDGVFVANADGEALSRLLEMDEQTIAVSTPLWSPDGRRLLFATATPDHATDKEEQEEEQGDEQDEEQGEQPQEQPQEEQVEEQEGVEAAPPGPETWPAWDEDPAGSTYHKRNVNYACWVAERPEAADAWQHPVQLFQARCNHPGYVASNLAVRWSRDGRRILYIDRGEDDRHGLHEYDLETAERTPLSPLQASALVFDVAPLTGTLSCLLADEDPEVSGIWFIEPGQSPWHVPNSTIVSPRAEPATLDLLRTRRPVWSPAGHRCVFASHEGGEGEEPETVSLWSVDVAQRQIDRLVQTPYEFRDITWHPDCTRLGFILHDETPRLHTVDLQGQFSPSLSVGPVDRFAGWNGSGERFAYTIAVEQAELAEPNWAILMSPVSHVRDRLLVAEASAPDRPREIFADARVTFPRWAPAEDRIGAWLTFVPPRQSVVVFFLVASLAHGDPAALVDADTGAVSWMTTSAWEVAQVGCYHLLQGRPEQALAWLQRAWGQLAEQPPPRDPVDGAMRNARMQVMLSVCQARLGKQEEVEASLAQLRREFRPDLRACMGGQEEDVEFVNELELKRDLDAMLALIHDLLIVEGFVGLESEEAAVALYRKQLQEATEDEVRLSRAVALSQLLLINGQNAEYAALAREQIVPLLFKLKPAYPEGIPEESGGVADLRRHVWIDLPALALVPLFSSKFLAELPAQEVSQHEQWLQLIRLETQDDVERFAVDIMRRALAQHRNRPDEQEEAERLIRENPNYAAFLGEEPLEGLDAKINDVTSFCF